MVMYIYQWLHIFVLTIILRIGNTASPQYNRLRTQNICKDGNFNPDCGANHVIDIHSAFWGRMENHCYVWSYFHGGCKHDKTKYLTNRCDNRRTCYVLVRGRRFPENACRGIEYLEVVYSCKTVRTTASSISTKSNRQNTTLSKLTTPTTTHYTMTSSITVQTFSEWQTSPEWNNTTNRNAPTTPLPPETTLSVDEVTNKSIDKLGHHHQQDNSKVVYISVPVVLCIVGLLLGLAICKWYPMKQRSGNNTHMESQGIDTGRKFSDKNIYEMETDTVDISDGVYLTTTNDLADGAYSTINANRTNNEYTNVTSNKDIGIENKIQGMELYDYATFTPTIQNYQRSEKRKERNSNPDSASRKSIGKKKDNFDTGKLDDMCIVSENDQIDLKKPRDSNPTIEPNVLYSVPMKNKHKKAKEYERMTTTEDNVDDNGVSRPTHETMGMDRETVPEIYDDIDYTNVTPINDIEKENQRSGDDVYDYAAVDFQMHEQLENHRNENHDRGFINPDDLYSVPENRIKDPETNNIDEENIVHGVDLTYREEASHEDVLNDLYQSDDSSSDDIDNTNVTPINDVEKENQRAGDDVYDYAAVDFQMHKQLENHQNENHNRGFINPDDLYSVPENRTKDTETNNMDEENIVHGVDLTYREASSHEEVLNDLYQSDYSSSDLPLYDDVYKQLETSPRSQEADIAGRVTEVNDIYGDTDEEAEVTCRPTRDLEPGQTSDSDLLLDHPQYDLEENDLYVG